MLSISFNYLPSVSDLSFCFKIIIKKYVDWLIIDATTQLGSYFAPKNIIKYMTLFLVSQIKQWQVTTNVDTSS